MKREEQIRQEAGCLSDFAIAHGAPWKEYQKGFIDGAKWADEHPVKPSLPSDLYEAAKQFQRRWDNDQSPEASFKAGAEWMAGQGVTKEAVIGMATKDIFINVSGRTLDELNLCPGDKVVVQIRKK